MAKTEDFKAKTDDQLAVELGELKREAFNLRFQSATGQLESHGRIRAVKRDIARLYTVIRERELGIRATPAAAPAKKAAAKKPAAGAKKTGAKKPAAKPSAAAKPAAAAAAPAESTGFVTGMTNMTKTVGGALASSVFAIAAATDWLDGYLARRLQQSTPFGAFLDPVADKLMVAVALVLLVEEHANLWLTLPAVIIIGREIVVSALREWMAELGARAQVAVSNLGKWKTAAQMLALVILLANPPLMTFWVILGYVLLIISAALTLWSMVHYLLAAWPHLSTTPKEK